MVKQLFGGISTWKENKTVWNIPHLWKTVCEINKCPFAQLAKIKCSFFFPKVGYTLAYVCADGNDPGEKEIDGREKRAFSYSIQQLYFYCLWCTSHCARCLGWTVSKTKSLPS